jgi:transcription termination factor NusB
MSTQSKASMFLWFTLGSGLFFGWLGYKPFGLGGGITGFIIGVLAALYVLGSMETDSKPNKVEIKNENQSINEEPTRNRHEEPIYYWDTSETVPVSAHLELTYQDVNGSRSTRTVRVSEYDGSNYLNGFCELRQQRRTFRLDRIISCIDTETGEVIQNIPQYLLEKYHHSPGYILDQALEKLSDILSVLYYVGKADGQLRAEERIILRAVVRKVAKHEEITDTMIDRCFNGASVPSLQAVKLAINRICKANGHNMLTTFKIAERIVATQKTVHPSETEILEYMQRKMEKEGITH